ncbi:hypothetical protein KY360_02325 [Candidatus Woesearchaeota archaeon]|nr:hypothetical protein [Candidatus Woesearchaeota archaeon]
MEQKNPNEQQIRFRTIIEILGKPKEHVEASLKKYVEQIKSDDNFMLIKEEFVPAEQKGKLFSTFAEIEVVSKSLPAMIGFCFDYMPSTMEIIKPEELKLSMRDMSSMLIDLQARLHKVDMVAKSYKIENDFVKRNMNALMKNLVMLLLKSKSLNLQQLSKFTGINEKELEPFLETLIKDNKIKKEEGTYSLA